MSQNTKHNPTKNRVYFAKMWTNLASLVLNKRKTIPECTAGIQIFPRLQKPAKIWENRLRNIVGSYTGSYTTPSTELSH